jgi:hypothetical protein
VSNPSVSRKFMPAGWIIAVAVLAIIGIAGSAGFRAHRGSSAKQIAAAPGQAPALSAEQRGRVRESLGTLPLAFEANQGQTDPQVKYMARGNGYTVFLTANDTIFALQSGSQSAARSTGKHGFAQEKTTPAPRTKNLTSAIRMHLVGGNARPEIAAGSQLPGVTNYYIGSDRSQWQEGVKQFAGVSYRDVYPGVNMAFHGEQRQLEFDFIVAAGASPAAIHLGISGARKIATDASGNLLLSSAAGDVVMHKPVAYQEINGKRQNVAAEFVQESNNRVAFALGSYDRSRELVIDPALSYATYVGGSAEDEAFAIALDSSGNAYVTGETKSPSFGGKPAGPTFNVFVTKVNSTGTAFVYTDIFAATGGGTNCSATGTGSCSGNAIAVDSKGNAYVAGGATAGFPTLSAFQTTYGGGTLDAFVLKLNPSGTPVYSTYLGGSGNDYANAIAVDGSGNAYVAGSTRSSDFPLQSAIQSTFNSNNEAFVTKVSSTGSTLSYSTYLGGSNPNLATGIALDSSNNAYVTGITDSSDFPTTANVVQPTFGGLEDGFVTEVKADGSAWVYSTYLGGSGTDDALAIAVDATDEAYVTGNTNSTNFPTANAAQSALGGNSATNVFVTKLNAGATALVFSTYYGGTLDDAGTGIALDSFGDAYVTGRTTSSNYPVSSAFQNSLSGTSDALVTEFSNTGFVVYSSFLGGTGTENDALSGSDVQAPVGAIAVDSTSNAYLAGATASTTGFPTTAGVVQANYAGGLADGFVAKVAAAPADFSVAVSPATTSTTSGSTTSGITVTVSSVNSSYGQAVALSCGSMPAHAACHFTSTSVTPAASAVTSTLTISTNGSASSSLLAPSTNGGARIFYAMLLPIGGIALLGAGSGSRRKRLFGFLLLGIILMGLLMLPACGGSSGGGGGGTNTPPGSYSITVSGQGGGATHSATLKLTVN